MFINISTLTIVDPDEFIIGLDSDDEGVGEHQENHSDESDSEAD